VRPGSPVDPPAFLALDRRGGDVWAWEKSITGTCTGLDEHASIAIVVNGKPFPARRDGSSFEALVRLRPGRNSVQAVCTLENRTWASDEVVHTVRLSPAPVAMIDDSATAAGFALDGSGSLPGAFDGAPITTYVWSLRRSPGTLHSRLIECGPIENASRPSLVLPVPPEDGEYVATLTVTDDRGRQDSASVMLAVERGSPRIMDPATERAAWTEGATIYGLVLRNIGEGNFQSAIDRLDDLVDLGVSALWLAPINPTVEGGFGYEVTDYVDVRPAYGTLADFRRFVDEAHARNLRVLIDVVPNHTSIEHPYCQDARAHGVASSYHDYYDRDAAGGLTSYFDWDHLPNLNFENPDVRRFVTEALMFWVKEMDVDGFRIDVAWGVQQRRPDFWREFCAGLKRVKPDGLLIAEASARDSYFIENGFDAAYDWTDQLGKWAWSEAFAGEAPVPATIVKALTNAGGPGYHPASVVLRFLNNNDTGPRFITTHGVDCYRVASAMLLTLPGLPCVYTGDEVGAEFEPYAPPRPIDWTDTHGLRAHFRKLIHLRKTLSPLRSLAWEPVAAEPAGSLLAYRRSGSGSPESLLVLLNFSPDPLDARMDSTSLGPAFQEAPTLYDLYNETSVGIARDSHLQVPVAPWGIRLLVPETAMDGRRDG
jgi:glycosidase